MQKGKTILKINKAIFIGDSHYNSNRTQLDIFLDTLSQNQTKTIFLSGDIFDFLSYHIKYFREKNKKTIESINSLSKTKDIIYLEGNHDFNLKDIFPNCHIIPREQQPYIFQLKNKTIAIAHGDIGITTAYDIFAKIMRSSFVGYFFNLIDIGGFISKKVEHMLEQKDICNTLQDFDMFASKRLEFYQKYKADYIIEAHYHQDKRYKNYINLPGFACNNRYLSDKDIVC